MSADRVAEVSEQIVEDIDLDTFPPPDDPGSGEGPEWVWARLAPEDLAGMRVMEVRSAFPGVEPAMSPRAVAQIVEEVLRRQGERREQRPPPTDRNLVSVAEFARHIDIAESTVFELLKRGLPSTKTKGLGRRILMEQAEAWLVAGGPERSRTAKRLAKTNGAPRG
jgi:hypothetical protein